MKVPPEPGDAPKYFGDVEVICDEVFTYNDKGKLERVTSRYRAFQGGELVAQSRSWAVVCLIAFGDIPTTVGGHADVAAMGAQELATRKTWRDPESQEERVVVSASIINYWNVILALDDGERIHLGEEGRLKRRFWMAASDRDAAARARGRIAKADRFEHHHVDEVAPPAPPPKPPRRVVTQGARFDEPPPPPETVRPSSSSGPQLSMFGEP